jgi:hypothetical protein
MSDEYRLLQLGHQLYVLGKDIRKLQKELGKHQKQGTLSSEEALCQYRQLEQSNLQWSKLEQEYKALENQLRPAKTHILKLK